MKDVEKRNPDKLLVGTHILVAFIVMEKSIETCKKLKTVLIPSHPQAIPLLGLLHHYSITKICVSMDEWIKQLCLTISYSYHNICRIQYTF